MNIEALYQQAELAQAAYATNLIPDDRNIDIGKLIDPGTCGMTQIQAEAFVNEWKVVNQLPDTASGFSGTLFRNNEGEYAFALRGTAGFTDLMTDLGDILADGIALDQIAGLEMAAC